MTALRAVSLDAGGTLICERQSRAALYRDSARSHGWSIETLEMHGRMVHALEALPQRLDGAWRFSAGWFRAFIADVFAPMKLPVTELIQLGDELFEVFANPATYRVFPGAQALLQGLHKAGLAVGVTSNWSPALTGLLRGLGLAEHLSFLLISAEVEHEKPDPRIFELALRASGCAPRELLHAGDHPLNDVRAPRALGLPCVWINHQGAPGEPDLLPCVDSLPELLDTILAWTVHESARQIGLDAPLTREQSRLAGP